MKFLRGLRACPYDFGCSSLIYSNVCYDVGVLGVEREWDVRMGTLGINKFFVISMCICFQVFLLQTWLKGLSISCTSFSGTFKKLQKYGVLKRDFIYPYRQGLVLWMFTIFVVGWIGDVVVLIDIVWFVWEICGVKIMIKDNYSLLK